MINNLNLTQKQLNPDGLIGAIVCRTPIDHSFLKEDNDCILISSVDQLHDTFGDPRIDPKSYSDLLIASKLLEIGIPLYISSVHDMSMNDDNFSYGYNGYTEFNFKDNNGHTSTTYRLKSNIKMCQPLITSEVINATLTLYVQLYLISDADRYPQETAKLHIRDLVKTITVTFDLANLTDSDIINALADKGLELQIDNFGSSTALVDELKQYRVFKASLDSTDEIEYSYTLNTDKYKYALDDDNSVFNAYYHSIDSIVDKSPTPYFLCMADLFKSESAIDTYIDSYGNQHTYTKYSRITNLDPDGYLVIQNYLLSKFPDTCDTYLFIGTPNVSCETILSLLSTTGNYTHSIKLPSQYNCDLYYGYAIDYINPSVSYSSLVKIQYQAAILAMYNMITNNSMYMSNAISNLNIACGSVPSSIDETYAKALVNNRCNSIVTFDKQLPSIYGNKSLANSANLQYSHISRNFIYIRRLIKEYLETRKFIIATEFNIQNSINYISFSILNQFVESGILSDYNISFRADNKIVYINLSLSFSGTSGKMDLNFEI